MQSQEWLDTVAISLIEGVGPVNARHLISYLGSPGAVLNAKPEKLQKVPGIGEKIAQLIKSNDFRKSAEVIIKNCEKQKVEIKTYLDPSYPTRLKPYMDAPLVLYCKGKCPLDANRIVALVGTRKATEYGKAITEKIVRDLVPLHPLIVSGLAFGIDIAAHRASIQQGMATVGVLAGGTDKIYPSEHRQTALHMQEQGGLLSEYPPGTIPVAGQFPARNRIIAALSDTVIVVEAAQKGGALITARYANQYSKEVYAVPAEVDKKFSEGCLHLIRNNEARIFTSVEDLTTDMSWSITSNQKSPKQKVREAVLQLEGDQKMVYHLLLDHEALHIDQLSILSKIELSKLASVLLSMEFNQLIKSLPGKKYTLI